MDESKILELALAAGFETDCKNFAAWDGADCTDKLFAFARLVAAAEREEIAGQLRAGGATLPAPENKGTVESAMMTGLSIALALIENDGRNEK